MANPKVQVPWEPVDWLLETIGAIALVFLIFYPFLYFGQLPEEILMHFNGRGEADGYSGKAGIWGLVAIALGTYLLLWYINKSPHLFKNNQVKITAENAFQQYQLSTRMIRITNVVMISFFAFIVYEIIQIGLGRQETLPSIVSYTFLAALVLIPVGYLIVNWRRYKP